MSDEKLIRAVLADGKVLIRQPDGNYREATGKTNWERVNARTDEEIEAAALADADAPPLDDQFWEKARIVLPPRIPSAGRAARCGHDRLVQGCRGRPA